MTRAILPPMRTRAAKALDRLTGDEYAALAEFRYELRCFHFFSEQAAREMGLAPQQHQALLAIRGSRDARPTVGELAKRLLIKPNSASELVARLVEQGLLERHEGEDGRVVVLHLSERAEDLLDSLSNAHLAELRRIKPLLDTLIDRIGS